METKECLSCKTDNPISASFCRKCGHRFPEHTKPGGNNMCHIENFSVKRQINDKFIVEWNAVNADKITLNGSNVTGYNKYTVTIKGSQIITLRAENSISSDVKESHVVYDSQTIYKDKIVKKNVPSETSIHIIIWLTVFVLLSMILVWYAYRLEDNNYNGTKCLSAVFGYKPYLMINGETKDRTIIIPAHGAALIYDIKTNADKYEIQNIPDWCVVDKNNLNFVINVPKNKLIKRNANIIVKTKDDNITLHLQQDLFKPQQLLVNDKREVYSHISSSSGQLTYQVSTDADEYEIAYLSPWFKVVYKDQNSFTIAYEKNPYPAVRENFFKVKVDGIEVKINLIQSSASNNTYVKKTSTIKEKTVKEKTGEIKDITIEHDVYEDGAKGMKIHLKFSVQNMKGSLGRCVAYMYYEDGTPLKDTNGSYRTTDGHCSFGKDFTPSYNSSTFNDFVIFVPITELEAGKGKYDMKFQCVIWDKSSDDSREIARSDYYYFILTKN